MPVETQRETQTALVTEETVGDLYARPIFFCLLSNDAAPSQAWTP